MKMKRNFVTAVIVLFTLGGTACGGKKKEVATANPSIMSLKAEGKTVLEQADELKQELADEYRIIILDYPHPAVDGSAADSERYGSHYNWKRLKTPAERRAAKEKLAQYVSLLARVIEIDAKEGVFVTRMDKVQSRYKGAIAFQNSLAQIEKLYGENKEFGGAETERIYRFPIEP